MSNCAIRFVLGVCVAIADIILCQCIAGIVVPQVVYFSVCAQCLGYILRLPALLYYYYIKVTGA